MSHGNASLTPTGRLRLASCVVDDGWPLRRAAERFGVSVTTAQRWSGRYRQQGQAGMGDRSSRPNRCPAQLPTRIEHRIMGLRVLGGGGQRGSATGCGSIPPPWARTASVFPQDKVMYLPVLGSLDLERST